MAVDNYLEGLVVDAIANDYEDFETIAVEVRRWVEEDLGRSITDADILDALSNVIHNGLGRAYVLSPVADPVLIEGVPERKVLREAYFLATMEGRRIADQRCSPANKEPDVT